MNLRHNHLESSLPVRYWDLFLDIFNTFKSRTLCIRYFIYVFLSVIFFSSVYNMFICVLEFSTVFPAMVTLQHYLETPYGRNYILCVV